MPGSEVLESQMKHVEYSLDDDLAREARARKRVSAQSLVHKAPARLKRPSAPTYLEEMLGQGIDVIEYVF